MEKALPDNVRKLDVQKSGIEGGRTGKITGIDENGQVCVDFPGNTYNPLPAKITHSVKLQIEDQSLAIGQDVLIVFENNDPELPVVIESLFSEVSEPSDMDFEDPEEILVDGERICFEAEKEIVFKCGKSSITLTRAGKVIIRGAYILNRSTGVNRIKGASVHLN